MHSQLLQDCAARLARRQGVTEGAGGAVPGWLHAVVGATVARRLFGEG
jgi:hypothetical protein